MQKRLSGIVAALFLCGPAAAQQVPAPSTGLKLIFDDEFSGSALDLTKWQLGTEPNGQQWGSNSYFVTSAPGDAALVPNVFKVANGVLTITANYDPNFVDRQPWGRHWYSGTLATAFSDGRTPSATFRRGVVEMRARLPSNKGAWSGMWALNMASMANGGDPLGQVELDGMEVYNEHPTNFPVTVHDWKDPVYNGAEQHAQAFTPTLPDLSADFHVYDYKVDDTNLTTYVDNVQVAQEPLYRPTTLDTFFWMINNAEGGNGWPVDEPPTGKMSMDIDYVRIYSADPTAAAVTPQVVSPPSISDTLVLTVGEDAYQGDAQFTVAVDGVQVGGTQTVTTLFKPNGATQDIMLTGSFGPGPHTVSVTFLNDLYDSGGDRNLYVIAITLDGVKTVTNGFQGSTGTVAYPLSQ